MPEALVPQHHCVYNSIGDYRQVIVGWYRWLLWYYMLVLVVVSVKGTHCGSGSSAVAEQLVEV